MFDSKRDSVVIVGSGLMGSGIAAVGALAGRKVILTDKSIENAERGKTNAFGRIDEILSYELTTEEKAKAAKKNISTSDSIEKALEKAGMVIEAIVENVEIKQDMFQKLDSLLPLTVPICSNTSGLRITDISAKTVHPERTVTTHFWLPAHLIPLVEVVVGDRTDVHVAEAVRDELKTWGKAPVLVKRDLPGQLANRIFQAIIREEISIVESGLATAEDVDTALKMGMAMRFPEWGPLEHLDAIGLELGRDVQNSVLPSIADNKQAGDYICKLVADGNIGAKSGKGFYDWTKKDIEEAKRKRDEFIVCAVKKVRELN